MKLKNNAGYSLVEVVVAIAILALIIVPVSTGMVTAFKMNAKAEQLMQAELAVSSAEESLMAKGIKGKPIADNEYPGVTVTITNPTEDDEEITYYEVTVKSDTVEVTTYIRAAEPTEPPATEEGGQTS